MFGKDIDKLIKQNVDIFMKNAAECAIKYINGKLTPEENAAFGKYIGYIVNDAIKKQQAGQGNAYAILDNNIRRLQNCRYTIDGKMDYINVGYAGRNYTHLDEFERCDVLEDSGNEDIDVAILQLNTKKTPDDVKYIYDMKYLRKDPPKPLGEKLYTIGYPHGEVWGLDDKAKSLEPTLRTTQCSKKPSRYTFDFQDSSQGGASGSPVIDEKGRLVGVLSTGYSGGSTQAVLGQYIEELYYKVNPTAKSE